MQATRGHLTAAFICRLNFIGQVVYNQNQRFFSRRRTINIVIDGYNVTGTGHENLRAARESLIESLVRYRKIRGHEITVVFDGWESGQGKETRTVTGGVAVIYSSIGEKADSVIKRLISGRQKKWVVVSSDREIVSYAWSASCVPIPSERFSGAMDSALEGGAGEDSYEERENSPGGKGSPHMRSKKQKEIERVVRKL